MSKNIKLHFFMLVFVALLMVAVGCASGQAAETDPEEGQVERAADMILHNGKIITVDEDFNIEQAVAIQGDEIIAVGDNDEVEVHEGTHTQMIDLNGKAVIPGLMDSHLHLISAAQAVNEVSLTDATSMDDVVTAIEEEVANTPSGEWVVGAQDWHEGSLKEGRLPTIDDLDPVSPENPVFIKRGGHVAVANSVALELAGITEDSFEDPSDGTIVRDDEGEPTGALFEPAARGLVEELVPTLDREELSEALQDAMSELNTYGVTSILEPGLNDEQISIYEQLWENDLLTTRSHLLYRMSDLDDVEHAVAEYPMDFGDDMLTLRGLKFLADGGVEAGFLSDPYEVVPGEQPDPDYYGHLLLPSGGEDELLDMYTLAAEEGRRVETHTVGDAAIDVILELYNQVNEEIPLADLHWSLQHLFLPTSEHMETMNELGITGTVQNHPTLLGHNQVRYHGQERAEYGIPIRKMLDHGVELGGGTDAPVLPLDPWLSLWWMTTRDTMTAGVLGPDQAVSREEALYLWTMGNARIYETEDQLGSIEPGKLADLAVLSDDYLSVPDHEIQNISSVMTILNGEIVYEGDVVDEQGEALPSTATNYPFLAIFGFIMALVAGGLLMFYRRTVQS